MKTYTNPRNGFMPTLILLLTVIMLLSGIVTIELYAGGTITSRTMAVMPFIVLFPVITALSIVFEIRRRRWDKLCEAYWQEKREDYEQHLAENQPWYE